MKFLTNYFYSLKNKSFLLNSKINHIESCVSSLFGTHRCKNINECQKDMLSHVRHNCLGTDQCVDTDGSYDCLSKCELSNVCDEKVLSIFFPSST